jgi:predicted  nucleic acid-binding Zn-ribbon protein
LKKQLELLVKLQACDSAIHQAQRMQENHPRMIAQLEETLVREREAHQQQEKLLDDTKKKRVQKEQELALNEDKVQKARQHLTAVKTNKEYQAALKEIELIQQGNVRIEEEILTIMEEAERLVSQKTEGEARFSRKAKETEEGKGVLESQLEACSREIEEHERLKSTFITQIQTELLDLYHKIKQKRPELTVVAVENSCCMGCHMNIPPQLFNEIKKCQKIITCPHCNRILFWEKNHETVAGTLQAESR